MQVAYFFCKYLKLSSQRFQKYTLKINIALCKSLATFNKT